MQTWTQRTSPIAEPSFNKIAWSPTLNMFATVGQQGLTGRVATSTDGINWVTRTGTGFNITGV